MIISTEIGPLTLGYVGSNLICEFGTHAIDRAPPKKLVLQLQQYFKGKRINTFDAPLPPSPPFMQKCLLACRNIPYGETITYGALAKAAGSPKAARAAGQAMRNNPTSIITPCHRVIASTGKLHGFSGKTDPHSKEIQRKQFLLTLERSNTNPL